MVYWGRGQQFAVTSAGRFSPLGPLGNGVSWIRKGERAPFLSGQDFIFIADPDTDPILVLKISDYNLPAIGPPFYKRFVYHQYLLCFRLSISYSRLNGYFRPLSFLGISN